MKEAVPEAFNRLLALKNQLPPNPSVDVVELGALALRILFDSNLPYYSWLHRSFPVSDVMEQFPSMWTAGDGTEETSE